MSVSIEMLINILKKTNINEINSINSYDNFVVVETAKNNNLPANNTSLESKIVDEVNTWVDSGIIKKEIAPIYNGIAIDVAKKVIDYSGFSIETKNYEGMDKNKATLNFQRDYIIQTYIESGFDREKAAKALGFGVNNSNKLVATNYLNQVLRDINKQLGNEILLKDVKNNPKKYIPNNPKPVFEYAFNEYLKSQSMIKSESLTHYVEIPNRDIVRKIVDFALDHKTTKEISSNIYSGMTLKDATKTFSKEYKG